VKAAERIGIRGSVAEPFLWDIETQTSEDVPRSPIDTKRAERLLGKELWRNKDKDALVRGHVGLFGAGTSSDELLLAAKACADGAQGILTQHQSFSVPVNEDKGLGKTSARALRGDRCAGTQRHVLAHERDPRR